MAKFELNDKVMRFVPGAEPSSVAVIFEFEFLVVVSGKLEPPTVATQFMLPLEPNIPGDVVNSIVFDLPILLERIKVKFNTLGSPPAVKLEIARPLDVTVPVFSIVGPVIVVLWSITILSPLESSNVLIFILFTAPVVLGNPIFFKVNIDGSISGNS